MMISRENTTLIYAESVLVGGMVKVDYRFVTCFKNDPFCDFLKYCREITYRF